MTTLRATVAISRLGGLPTEEFVRLWNEREQVITDLQSQVDSLSSAAVAQNVTPLSGDTVQMTNTPKSGFLRIQGSGTLTSLAIAHPDDAHSVNGQIRSVYFDRAITSITWPNSTAMNLPSSAAAGDSVTTQRLESGLWMRRA